MAKWQVIAAPIELYPHPDPKAERLLLGKLGQFQVVVNKDSGYKDGDVLVFAPERSVLPDEIKGEYVNTDTGVSYLGGPDLNRVKSVRLRGELSEGAILDSAWVARKLCEARYVAQGGAFPCGVDLAPMLGITKYIPEIPESMRGAMTPIDVQDFKDHDVEQFGLYEKDFTPGEPVLGFIKYHGTQVTLAKQDDGSFAVSSKGYSGDDMGFVYNPDNFYWKALANTGILESTIPGEQIQVWGEAIPCHSGYSYGLTRDKPTVVFFRLRIDGREIPFAEIESDLQYKVLADNWARLVYEGPFDPVTIREASKALKMECYSGKKLHVNEGIVISPAVPRRSRDTNNLMVKAVNPKFRPTEEDFS